MKVSKCAITGDELFCDDVVKYEIVDGLIKARGKYVTRSADSVDEKAIGANPSAEEASDALDDKNSVSGVNIVLDGHYVSVPGFGSKKDFQLWLKDYLKRVKEIKSAQAGFSEDEFKTVNLSAAKKLISISADAEYFTGSSGKTEGMLILLNWETPEGEEDEAPFLYYIESGVVFEKY